jgi:hypothetical protein
MLCYQEVEAVESQTSAWHEKTRCEIMVVSCLRVALCHAIDFTTDAVANFEIKKNPSVHFLVLAFWIFGIQYYQHNPP